MCQNELWLRQLKSFVSSFEPYGCNHEEFPGVKVSFQALDSKIKENDEENKKLHNNNEAPGVRKGFGWVHSLETEEPPHQCQHASHCV